MENLIGYIYVYMLEIVVSAVEFFAIFCKIWDIFWEMGMEMGDCQVGIFEIWRVFFFWFYPLK